MLTVLIGCGLRRDEAARLNLSDIAQRDGRWCVVDVKGKHGLIRTIPMPHWAKMAVDSWLAAVGVTTGRIFRGVNKGGKLTGDFLTTQGVLRCVQRYASSIAPHADLPWLKPARHGRLLTERRLVRLAPESGPRGDGMSVFKRGDVDWYEFTFKGERIRESTHQPNKNVAHQIMAARRTEDRRRPPWRSLQRASNSRSRHAAPTTRLRSRFTKNFCAWLTAGR